LLRSSPEPIAVTGCECNKTGAFLEICEDKDLCGKWAGKDVDWPDGGAYAFGLKFPSTFVADDQDHRPTPRCLRRSEPGWKRAADPGPGQVARRMRGHAHPAGEVLRRM